MVTYGFKKGFTLAEVLITIAIIGIVAALTIPTLIHKYQDYSLKVQFKKTYAMLRQAMQMAEYDFGVPPKCYYWDVNPYGPAVCSEYAEDGNTCIGGYVLVSTGKPVPSDYSGIFTECSLFGKAIGENLKFARVCKKEPYANGCVPEYEGRDTYDGGSQIASGMPSAQKKDNLMNENYTMVLADGTIVINGWSTVNISPQLFFVDINGKKGPNKWGYDLFSFRLYKDSEGILKFKEGSGFKESGGKTVDEMLQEISSK